MKFKLGVFVTAAALTIAAFPVAAHHSFAAEYDSTKPITVAGTVTKVEWTNPHARLYVDVKDEKGVVANWNIEMGGPLQLKRLGWNRDSVKPGDDIKIDGYAAKDGENRASARNVVFADGRKIFIGSTGEGAPDSGK